MSETTEICPRRAVCHAVGCVVGSGPWRVFLMDAFRLGEVLE